MMSLEEEFKRRNALERTCAEYHAWSLGKESTYAEPEIPNYIHLHDDLQDTTILPNYTPDFGNNDLSWFW